jgi:hypothetical protein
METIFEYGKITDGKFVPMPELKNQFETEWPHHQIMIDHTLLHHQMNSWKIRLMPSDPDDTNPRKGRGNIAYRIKLIVIFFHTKHEMTATLYHEILHQEHPDWTEEQVEAQTRKVFPQKPVNMLGAPTVNHRPES